jgi:hypothetical protein
MAYARRPNAKQCGAATVGTSSSVIVPENASRLRITICNNSANDVTLALRTSNGLTPAGPTAVLNAGIVLKANGGSWSDDAYTGPIAAIAATSSVSVGVTEI